MSYIRSFDMCIQELPQLCCDFYKGVLLARFLDLENERESFTSLSYKRVISTSIRELGLIDYETKDNKEIVDIFNKIINHLCGTIENLLNKVNKKEFMIGLYSMASYMTRFHYYMDMVSEGVLSEKKIRDTNLFDVDEKNILIKVLVNKDDCAADFNSWRGFDKAVIQTLFYRFEFSNNNRENASIDLNFLMQLYNYVSALVTLINEREFVTSGFYRELVVHVTENDIVINKEKGSQRVQLLRTAYNNRYKKDLVQFDKVMINKLEPEIFRQYGFKVSTVENVFENKTTSNLLNRKRSIMGIIEHKKLIQLIRNEGRCSKEEAEKVIQYFTLTDNIVDKNHESFEKYDSRLLKQPLVRWDDNHYLLSYYLMMYAIFILKTNMVYDLMLLNKNKNARIIEKGIKGEFERLVQTTISPYMSNSKLNVQKLSYVFNGKRKEINLKYEIDIIALRGEKLYLFECKDIAYKFTSGGIRNDIHKTLKFINRIHDKIDEINQYKEEFTLYLGAQFDEIVPILVFKHYNVTGDSEVDCRGVNVLSFTELEKWLKLVQK